MAELVASGLTFAHEPGIRQLDDVSFAVRAGQVLCLLGPNGTGKTTLLRCLLGVLKPQRGSVTVDGRDISRMSAAEVARSIAYVPQNGTTGFPFSVLDVVVMGRSTHLRTGATPSDADYELAFGHLEMLGMGHLVNRTFNAVSGGERQLALIARALTQASLVLILDEPTASLDFGNQARILQVVSQLSARGHAVVMTSHMPDHAFACADTVALLKAGRLLAKGAPGSVINEDILTELYGVPVRIAALDPDTTVCLPILDTTPGR